jgi:hypothetical protein
MNENDRQGPKNPNSERASRAGIILNGNSVLSLRQSRVLSRLRERFAINGPPMIMVAL